MENKGLEKLREKFLKHQISLLPRPTKKDNPKGPCKECGGYHGLPAVHLEYVGHAALTDRLLDSDINWNWEPMAVDEKGLPRFDESGGLWIKLTVCGQTRLGYGNAQDSEYKDIGSREKEVIGDALRNAAMRFGAALDLWHKGDLHKDAPVDKKRDFPKRETLQTHSYDEPKSSKESTFQESETLFSKMNLPSPNEVDPLAVIPNGTYVGRALIELMEEDSKQNFKYAHARVKDFNQNTPKYVRDYLALCREEGVI